MPRYPALEIQQPDVPRMFAIGSMISGNRTRSKLAEAKLGQIEQKSAVEVEGRRLRGEYLAAEPEEEESAFAALTAFDPDDAAKLQDIVSQASQEDREAMEQQNLKVAQMAQYIVSAPNPMVQQSRWTEVRASSPEIASRMPESYDQDWADLQITRIMARDELLRQDEAPSGYRSAEGGLEFTPGGPADPAQAGKLAEAKREPDGGATPAQQANNAEIDAARQALDRMNLDRAEILRRTQKSTNTGRENPDYDPSLERLVRTATQRKVGNDPKFNLFHRRYLGPAPQFSKSAGPKALPPGVSAEQPGVFDRIGEFFSGGDDTPAPASDDGRPRGRRRGRGRIRGQSGAKAIESMSLDEVTDLIFGGRELSQDEKNRLDARLKQLGH